MSVATVYVKLTTEVLCTCGYHHVHREIDKACLCNAMMSLQLIVMYVSLKWC